MMELILRRSTTGHAVRFLLIHEYVVGLGLTGLTPETDGLRMAYLRDGDLVPTIIPLCPWQEDAHMPGGFREIDSELMPGLYEVQLPDEICLPGASRATVMVQVPGASSSVINIDLVAYDPYDSYRLGLDCLSREARHEVISRAFREVVPDIVEEFRRKA